MTTDTSALLARFAPGWPANLDVYDEWLPRLVQLDVDLAAIDPDYTLAQVKVKFGGLRYYYDTTSDRRQEMDVLVCAAEEELDK